MSRNSAVILSYTNTWAPAKIYPCFKKSFHRHCAKSILCAKPPESLYKCD